MSVHPYWAIVFGLVAVSLVWIAVEKAIAFVVPIVTSPSFLAVLAVAAVVVVAGLASVLWARYQG